MSFYFYYTLSKFGVLFVPGLVVSFWRSRPKISLFVALLIMFLLLFVPGVIKTFQALTIFGTGDSQRLKMGIVEALLIGLTGLLMFGPVLIMFQWVMRKIFKNKDQVNTVFD